MHFLTYKLYKFIKNNNFRLFITTTMAKSKFEYVKQFESESICLLNCWIVVRIDGWNFSKFTDIHKFNKPNDFEALELMNASATVVMKELKEIVVAFGASDEYSFVFRKETESFNRRESKLLSNVNSLFSSAYVFNWPKFFKNTPMKYPPAFDARIVVYPSDRNLRDYLSWRQADVHINNLYNTCFWNIVQKQNKTTTEAQEMLKGTFSSDKNELLFSTFGINYNNEPQMFRKGTTLIRKIITDDQGKKRSTVLHLYEDIIGDKFWTDNPEILGPKQSVTNNQRSSRQERQINKKQANAN